MDYMDYDQQLKENRNRNEVFLDEFENWLDEKSLSNKTICNHIRNVMIFINGYLTYDELIKMEDGIDNVYDFFDYWFIRKCFFSSVSAMKSIAGSLKKFYQCMGELGHVDKDAYIKFWEDYKFYEENFIDSFDAYENGESYF